MQEKSDEVLRPAVEIRSQRHMHPFADPADLGVVNASLSEKTRQVAVEIEIEVGRAGTRRQSHAYVIICGMNEPVSEERLRYHLERPANRDIEEVVAIRIQPMR